MMPPTKPQPRWIFAAGCERETLIAGLLTVLGASLLAVRRNIAMGVLGMLLATLGSIILYFFRDPERTPPADESLIVSPADGTVVALENAQQEFIGNAMRVSIFLSLFDVHVNRAPFTGRVRWIRYETGQFGHAGKAAASELNERNTLAIERDGVKIVVRQIAGLVARRIVCWAQPEQTVTRGERFGLIKFGSRVDVFMPSDVKILVRLGEHVKGGESAIAQLTVP
jgi:phosphatidylserine decarboxylase